MNKKQNTTNDKDERRRENVINGGQLKSARFNEFIAVLFN